MNDILKKKKVDRFNFLKHLYEVTGGSSLKHVNSWELGEEIGLDRETTENVVEYLRGKDLVKSLTMDGGLSISPYGVHEVEEALSSPENSTEHFPPINIIHVANMNNSAIQQGSDNSTQSVTFDNNKIDSLNELIMLLEEKKSQFKLPSEAFEELKAEIDTLKSQSNSPKPKNIIIKESLKTIRTLIEGVAAGAGTPMILELIKNLNG